jgi:hypothetical protein
MQSGREYWVNQSYKTKDVNRTSSYVKNCSLIAAFSCSPTSFHRGRDSSVGVATRYGLDGPGIESRTRPDGLWGPPSLLYNGYGVIPGGKAARAWR